MESDGMQGDDTKPKRGRPKGSGVKPRLTVVPVVPNDGGKIIRLTAGQGKDSNGLTSRQEQFCQGVGTHLLSQSDAYRAAYNAENMTSDNINNEAYKLMRRPEVISRVNTLVDDRMRKTSHDSARIKQHVIEKLWLESQDTKNPATVRVRALELLGKMTTVSLFTDRVMTETVEARSPEDIEQQIRDKLAKMAG
jgi:hypothetical protein